MLRKAKKFYDKGLPAMTWNVHNLFNISSLERRWHKIFPKNVGNTLFQQQWQAKKYLRAYHGEHIREQIFKRWFVPQNIPRVDELPPMKPRRNEELDRIPLAALFVRDVERRLDTVIFRCCFATSARQAAKMCTEQSIRVNGEIETSAARLLLPGDLISVDPKAIPMLDPKAAMAASAEELKEAQALEKEKRKAQKIKADSQAQLSKNQSQEGEKSEELIASSEQNSATVDTSAATEGVVEATELELDSSSEVKSKRSANENLPEGVLPFTLPPYASPFLFVPPYLEVSFSTCSAIYLRHPTITAGKKDAIDSPAYNIDIPSPFPVLSSIYSLGWEWYSNRAPRIRSDLRRVRTEARVGKSGHSSARAKDQWRRVVFIRKGGGKVLSMHEELQKKRKWEKAKKVLLMKQKDYLERRQKEEQSKDSSL